MARYPVSPDAKNNPVVQSDVLLDTLDESVGQESPRTLDSTGPASKALSERVVEPVERPIDDEKVAMLAFMNEAVTIRFATTTDKNAEQIFEVSVNGNHKVFKRGETYTVPRYIADRLARIKETHYDQREVVNNEGVRQYVYDPRTALKYDFTIVKDTHKRGADWFRHVLAEAA